MISSGNKQSGYATVRAMVGKFNKDLGGSDIVPLYCKLPGMRVWTRGDGVRYRDPGTINLSPNALDSNKKWTDAESIDLFWKWLSATGARQICDVSGSFRSDPYYPAMTFRRMVFVNHGCDISWGSISRLQNSTIWRQKPEITPRHLV